MPWFERPWPLEVRPRWPASSAELEKAEADWWAAYGELEEQFCWVQSDKIRSFLRGAYVRRMTEGIPQKARILEYGCGTGWLCQMLTELGFQDVIGVDVSEDQIERACAHRLAHPAKAAPQFFLLKGPPELLPETLGNRSFDVLILHCVLHHLSDEELSALFRTFAARLANPQTRIIVLEPVQYVPNWNRIRVRMVNSIVNTLVLLPLMGRRFGVRRIGPAELEKREQLQNRGPSPKETPFLPDELPQLIRPWVTIESKRSVLCFSFLAAKNLLLTGLSHPRRAAMLGGTYLALARFAESILLRFYPEDLYLSVFELWEGRLHAMSESTEYS